MLKILIVEDEPPLLRDISRMVQEISNTFLVIAQVTNAKQAMELIKADSPDVLITDIHMPVISGMELIHWIQENGYKIIPIILTGYEKFEYAHKAISMDVPYYLLKPVEIEKLRKILRKIEKEIIKDKIFNNMFGSNTLTKNNRPSISEGSYIVLMFCVGYYPADPYEDYLHRPQFWEKEKIDLTISSQIPESCHVWVFKGNNQAIRFAVIQFEEKDTLNLQRILDTLYKLYANHRFTLTIMVSDAIRNIINLRKTAKELTSKLRTYILLGKFQIITDLQEKGLTLKPIKSEINSQQLFLLYKYISLKDKASVKFELSSIQDDIRNLTYTQICVEITLSEIIQIFKNANAKIPDIIYIQLQSKLKKLAVLSLNKQMLNSQIESIFSIILKEWDYMHDTEVIDYHQYLIQRVEEYILKNLFSPLNNLTIAEHFGFSPAYLSKIFRIIKGISPIDYITIKRIERAKDLFSNSPSKLIKEVSSIVGFTDPYYFSKVFKKHEGISPKEYINKIDHHA